MSSDRLFRAFSESVRRRAVRLLSRGSLCVCDISDALKLPQPTVSRHLSALHDAGLIRVEKRGRWRHYSLVPAKTRLGRALIACATVEGDSDGDFLRRKSLPTRNCP